jgi:SAM-dependent methyltransferase
MTLISQTKNRRGVLNHPRDEALSLSLKDATTRLLAKGLLKEAVAEVANALLAGKRHVKSLEAGCGSATQIRLKPSAYVVGIDVSKDQLSRNEDVQEKIVGDIQTYSLPKDEFDVAVCWMVLEHLPRPQDALLNLFESVKPQGLLILGVPHLLSFKGVVTRITPFWFHVLFYRLMKYTSRPFPTYCRADILPTKMIRLAENNGFQVVFCELMEGGVAKRLRSRFWFVDLVFSFVNSIVQFISFGRAQSLFLDNCAIILKKCEGRSPNA